MPSHSRTCTDEEKSQAEPFYLACALSGHSVGDMKALAIASATAGQASGWHPEITTNGKSIGWSDLLRYAGKVGGLYPENAPEALRVDAIVETVKILIAVICKARGAPPGTQMHIDMVREMVMTWLKTFNALLEKTPSSRFFVGDIITIADLQVFSLRRLLKSTDFIPAVVVEANAPSFEKHYDTIMSNPTVMEYITTETQGDSGCAIFGAWATMLLMLMASICAYVVEHISARKTE